MSEEEVQDKAAAAAKKKETFEEAQRRKKEEKARQSAASKAAKEAPDQPEFTKMEIRVGKITKVWHHPSADKLFCEEIDLAEEEGPRQIASGLRGHYTLEEMQGRKVLVVCNLKAAKIVGFTSNGMVLAAKVSWSWVWWPIKKCDYILAKFFSTRTQSENGEKVELVSPPDDAPIGEKVTLEGLDGTLVPLSSAQTKKKKTMEIVAKDLKTSDTGIATWQDKPLITSKGPCKVATLVGAFIS